MKDFGRIKTVLRMVSVATAVSLWEIYKKRPGETHLVISIVAINRDLQPSDSRFIDNLIGLSINYGSEAVLSELDKVKQVLEESGGMVR